MVKYISYCRVSTKRQGDSGLGLEAQENAIKRFVDYMNGEIIASFKEIESGGNKELISINNTITLNTLLKKRPTLKKAIELAKNANATILVKESSRLSRYSLLIDYLIATSVKFICVDSPQDEPMIIKIKTAVVEEELKKNSRRISEALAVLKASGYVKKKSTTVRNYKILGKKSHQMKEFYDSQNQDYVRVYLIAKRMIKEKQSFKEILAFIHKMGFRTSRGCKFSLSTLRTILNNDLIKKEARAL